MAKLNDEDKQIKELKEEVLRLKTMLDILHHEARACWEEKESLRFQLSLTKRK